MDLPYSFLHPLLLVQVITDSTALYNAVLLFFLFCLLTFTSIAETAFLTIKLSQIAELKKSEKPIHAKLLALLDKPFSLRAVLHTAHAMLMVSIILTAYFIINNWLYGLLESSAIFAVTGIALALFLIVACLFLPKIFAQKNNVLFAEYTYPLVWAISGLLTPLTNMLLYFLKVINTVIKPPFKITPQEFNRLNDHQDINEESEEERLILRGIANFSSLSVKQIMCSRTDVVALSITISQEEVLRKVTEAGYSRIPVYENSFDNIKGILNVKDLLISRSNGNNSNWQKLLRTPFFVPESIKIDDLLRDFKAKRTHMAIVVDEYGGTAGIATLEDILEELVGEINDEYDELEDELKYSKLDANTYVFDGKTALNDIYRLMNLPDAPFEEVRGEADTIGGLVLELAGRFVHINEKIAHKNYTFTVESADKKRIKRVKISVTHE